jgi:hypothetical protein
VSDKLLAEGRKKERKIERIIIIIIIRRNNMSSKLRLRDITTKYLLENHEKLPNIC